MVKLADTQDLGSCARKGVEVQVLSLAPNLMFDTHAHLNFSKFDTIVEAVIERARMKDVDFIVVPGTDYASSVKAVGIAEKHDHIYAAVGMHPHHVFELYAKKADIGKALEEFEELYRNPHVVAVGEIGIDKHEYGETKYDEYHIDKTFLELQRSVFIAQLEKAIDLRKSVIVHNREATDDVLAVINTYADPSLAGRLVFHCCEPEKRLLECAIERNYYIGVDGDITYSPEKQEFIKHVPVDQLVLETDSPYLLPEPLKSEKKYPNEPANIPIIAQFVATLLNKPVEEIQNVTTENAKRLFNIK